MNDRRFAPRTGVVAPADRRGRAILSQHPGGFVLTHDRLDDLVPSSPPRWSTGRWIEWARPDIDALKFMKVDVLGLGMTRLHEPSLQPARGSHRGGGRHGRPAGRRSGRLCHDPEADTLGTFQIESRAQMSMLPRMKPARFYDLVIEDAIVAAGADPGRHGSPLSPPPRGA